MTRISYIFIFVSVICLCVARASEPQTLGREQPTSEQRVWLVEAWKTFASTMPPRGAGPVKLYTNPFDPEFGKELMKVPGRKFKAKMNDSGKEETILFDEINDTFLWNRFAMYRLAACKKEPVGQYMEEETKRDKNARIATGCGLAAIGLVTLLLNPFSVGGVMTVMGPRALGAAFGAVCTAGGYAYSARESCKNSCATYDKFILGKLMDNTKDAFTSLFSTNVACVLEEQMAAHKRLIITTSSLTKDFSVSYLAIRKMQVMLQVVGRHQDQVLSHRFGGSTSPLDLKACLREILREAAAELLQGPDYPIGAMLGDEEHTHTQGNKSLSLEQWAPVNPAEKERLSDNFKKQWCEKCNNSGLCRGVTCNACRGKRLAIVVRRGVEIFHGERPL